MQEFSPIGVSFSPDNKNNNKNNYSNNKNSTNSNENEGREKMEDKEFEFDAPQYCELEDSEYFFKTSPRRNQWFQETHWMHEPPEKRPSSLAKRRASSFTTLTKSSVIQNKKSKPNKPSSHSPIPKDKLNNNNNLHNNGNNDNNHSESKHGLVSSRSEPYTHIDLSLSPSDKTSFSPIESTPTKNNHNNHNSRKSNNINTNKVISQVMFSPSSKLFSPPVRKLGLPQRVLSPDVKEKPKFVFDHSDPPPRKPLFSIQEEEEKEKEPENNKENQRSSNNSAPSSSPVSPQKAKDLFALPSFQKIIAASKTGVMGSAKRIVEIEDQEEVNNETDVTQIELTMKKSRKSKQECTGESDEDNNNVRIRSTITNCPAPAAKKKSSTTKTSNTKPKKKKYELEIELDDDISAMLAEHNKKFKPVPKYEPRTFSVKEVKLWEEHTGKQWYSLNPQEREEANAWMKQMKKMEQV